MEFSGFKVSDTSDGLSVTISHRQLFVFSKILLSAKFPPDYIYSADYLLSPYLNQLIDVVSDRLHSLADTPGTVIEFPQDGPFVQAVFKAIDDYIAHSGVSEIDRDNLLRQAFKPHKVEGFK